MGEFSIASRIGLNNGTTLPLLGLGVWQIAPGEETEQAVTWALEAGYRHIDTASLYGNEESVGNAVRAAQKNGIPREEIFITTKLWPTDAFDPEHACTTSLKRLNAGYIDLYLIHWPIPLFGNRTWRSLERLYEGKLVRAIGVSNYSVPQLEELLKSANIPPAVNQIEFNPFSWEKPLAQFCTAHGIVVEAYSPLTRGTRLDDETLGAVASRHAKTPAQVLLRWALQKGAAIIPKSSHRDRIRENADVFDFALSEDDMRRLDALRS